jgi:gamma-glutamyltranspeptidase/glutathione hydrolase
MATIQDELYCPFGVMGGFMQPQGHVQVLVNMIDYGMDPQQALDAPRFCINDGVAGGQVYFEEGISDHVISVLKAKGHVMVEQTLRGFDRSMFGRGQIIRKLPNGILWAGSDPRADGAAYGWF